MLGVSRTTGLTGKGGNDGRFAGVAVAGIANAKPHEPQKRCDAGIEAPHDGQDSTAAGNEGAGGGGACTVRMPHSPQNGSDGSAAAPQEEQFTELMGPQVSTVRQASARLPIG